MTPTPGEHPDKSPCRCFTILSTLWQNLSIYSSHKICGRHFGLYLVKSDKEKKTTIESCNKNIRFSTLHQPSSRPSTPQQVWWRKCHISPPIPAPLSKAAPHTVNELPQHFSHTTNFHRFQESNPHLRSGLPASSDMTSSGIITQWLSRNYFMTTRSCLWIISDTGDNNYAFLRHYCLAITLWNSNILVLPSEFTLRFLVVIVRYEAVGPRHRPAGRPAYITCPECAMLRPQLTNRHIFKRDC